jgi:hypothetical protein
VESLRGVAFGKANRVGGRARPRRGRPRSRSPTSRLEADLARLQQIAPINGAEGRCRSVRASLDPPAPAGQSGTPGGPRGRPPTFTATSSRWRRHDKGRSRAGRPRGCRAPALIAWPVRSRTYRRFDRIGRCTCPRRSCLWRTCRRRGCSVPSRSASIPRAQAAPLVAAVARDGLTRGPHQEAAGRWRRTRPARWAGDAAPCATPGTGRRRPPRSTAHRRARDPSVWCQAALVVSLSLLRHSKDSSGVTVTLAAVRAGANRLSCPFRARRELTPTERRRARLPKL